jgi:hypothetical protein
MLRKQTRRSFTVEIKYSPPSGRSAIPAKPPQAPRKGKHLASPTPSLASLFEQKAIPASITGDAVEPRRILPSLIVWEPSAPEPEIVVQPEAPVPRVRRPVPPQEADQAPRRRGRPLKLKLEPEPAAETPTPILLERMRAHPESPGSSQAMSETPARPPRTARIEGSGLPRAERWKRRLPRACW